MDNKQIRVQLTTSFLAVYGCAGDGNMIAAYVQVLQDIPVEILRKAYDKVMLTCDKRPVPAVVYKTAKELVEQFNGTNILSWAEAWKEIEKQMKEVFVYGKPKFSRKEIEETVRAYGWRDLCETDAKNMNTARAQLRNMYYEICNKSEDQKINGYLLGNNQLLETVKKIGKGM